MPCGESCPCALAQCARHSELRFLLPPPHQRRELANRPSPKVAELLEGYYATLPLSSSATPQRLHSEMVSVHIRMVDDVRKDTPGVSEEEAVRMELATAFRVSCHYKFFLKRMLAYPPATTFFMSSDHPDAYAAMRSEPQLKGRVFYLDNSNCLTRDARCMTYAAADLVLLSRTSGILKSTWSAFSETAAKMMGPDRSAVDGCDAPEGGWKTGGAKEVLRKQIIEYLTAKKYPGVENVKTALQRYAT